MELVSLKQLFQRLNGGRLLGLDVGSRNIGVAVSDPQCRIASPHSVLYRTQSTMLKNISRLETLVQEFSITGFVIGYPLELTGFQGKQGAQVKLFVRELQLSKRFPTISYVYWDERLTSMAVMNVIGSMDISGRRRKSIMDKMSALCILQVLDLSLV
jgi:putative Holliday junction resolvase